MLRGDREMNEIARTSVVPINTKDHASKLSSSSLPGLTRQSIVLKILGFFKMDARVKPGNDESIIARMSISPQPLPEYG
jgi:hypothetical protein